MVETYRQALARAFSLLETSGINPQIAEWLCLHLTGYSKAKWLLSLDQPIPMEQARQLTSWLERVVSGEPYQYVIGRQDFFGREFIVNPAVLIPRPETELLVEQVLHKLEQIWPDSSLTGVDVGTGSGVIAITLDLEMNQREDMSPMPDQKADTYAQASLESPRRLEMLAVDISTYALAVAKENARKLQANVSFWQSDLLEILIEQERQVDFIVSNPPYIPLSERNQLERNVVDFEPHLALFAEENGLYFYQEITKQARVVLNSPGLLAFEVGMGQAQAVSALIQDTLPQARCEIKKDLSGIERIVLAII